jgi:hypothetical protein
MCQALERRACGAARGARRFQIPPRGGRLGPILLGQFAPERLLAPVLLEEEAQDQRAVFLQQEAERLAAGLRLDEPLAERLEHRLERA